VRWLYGKGEEAMKKEKIIVLGGGLVGGPMALDLAVEERFAVTVVDVNEVALEERQVVCEEEVIGGSPILC
jgi:saccharopine dehydrogenase-like NADP-dependent oxidoreductase